MSNKGQKIGDVQRSLGKIEGKKRIIEDNYSRGGWELTQRNTFEEKL